MTMSPALGTRRASRHDCDPIQTGARHHLGGHRFHPPVFCMVSKASMALCLRILRITGSEQSDTAFSAIHQKLTRTSWVLHQSCEVGLTRRAVTLKESRGRLPQSSSRASHVCQVTLHLHPFPNNRTWLTRACRITVDRAATSGVRSNRGVGQSHQPCAQPMAPLDCLMRIQA